VSLAPGLDLAGKISFAPGYDHRALRAEEPDRR
jgi:hypothetical protein